MYQYEDLFELVFDNLKRIVFPEEWLALDIEMSKQELFSIMIVDRLGEITMSQLSDQMNFPMSTATGIIDRLVKKGYVHRGKSESDRRIVAITLTDKGRAFTQSLRTTISDYIKKAYDSLNEEERQYLQDV
jgi:DNA-binding MarR family transcriptional regulator